MSSVEVTIKKIMVGINEQFSGSVKAIFQSVAEGLNQKIGATYNDMCALKVEQDPTPNKMQPRR